MNPINQAVLLLVLAAAAVAQGPAPARGAAADLPPIPAKVPASTLSPPTSPSKPPDADGFIPRWMILEPIPANGLTESVVNSAVKKEYFPDQFTVIPKDGDKVAVGDQELTWHAVDTRLYNVNLYHFARHY